MLMMRKNALTWGALWRLCFTKMKLRRLSLLLNIDVCASFVSLRFLDLSLSLMSASRFFFRIFLCSFEEFEKLSMLALSEWCLASSRSDFGASELTLRGSTLLWLLITSFSFKAFFDPLFVLNKICQLSSSKSDGFTICEIWAQAVDLEARESKTIRGLEFVTILNVSWDYLVTVWSKDHVLCCIVRNLDARKIYSYIHMILNPNASWQISLQLLCSFSRFCLCPQRQKELSLLTYQRVMNKLNL